jgi:uncharacterized protein YigA (DUF484 family)
MTSAYRKPEQGAAEAVEAFLRENPSWLADNPELYRALTPPRRIHGEPLADHMAAMLRAERSHAAEMAQRADFILAAGRATAGLTARVQEAVLALMRATDTLDCLSGELPGVLGLDAVALCVEAHLPGVRSLPPGTVATALGGRDVVFRAAPADAVVIHAEAARLARHDALVRVPTPGAPALLALVARDRSLLEPGQGAGALAFLGRAVATALARQG